jgi:hypothetical protein
MRPLLAVLLVALAPAARAGDIAPPKKAPKRAPPTQAPPAPAPPAPAPPALDRLFQAGDPDALEAAGEELLAAGLALEPQLLAALPGLRPDAAAVALGVLAELDAPGAAGALLRAADAPEEPRRQAAADQLPRFVRLPEAVLALVRLCSDASAEVALAAAGGLRATRPPGAFDGLVDLVGLAEDSPRPATRVAAEALGHVFAASATEPRVERLLAAARMAPAAGRRLLLEVVAGGGAPAADALLGLLEAGFGVELLGEEARARVRDQLGELADAVTEETREVAVRGLGRVAATDARAARAMTRALVDRGPRVRALGVRGLFVPAAAVDRAARLEALGLLVEVLVDPDDGLRRAAHARLVRETRQTLPLSQPEWSRWLERERAAPPPATTGEGETR